LRNKFILHEVIVTSPLGLVPRELELFYPAQQYDISVTGYWEDYEIKLVNKLLKFLVRNNNYDLIINHTGYDFLDLDAITTFLGKPTSKDSIQKLFSTLKEVTSSYEVVERERRLIEDMTSRAKFQFGKAESLVKDCRVVGNYPKLRIVSHDKLLATLSSRGMLALTLEGAERINTENVYWVEIDDFKPKGDIFAAGVVNAFPEIRHGDEIIVRYRQELRAVGIAKMCSKELVESSRGLAVRVRNVSSKD
jgi:archaeosine synthase